ncbi:MAG TPA: S8 family serine peptidase [Thermoanaerobaculia bacterium]
MTHSRRLIPLILLAVLATTLAAAPPPDEPRFRVVDGTYLVRVDSGIPRQQVAAVAGQLVARYGGTLKGVYEYALPGFAVEKLSKRAAARLAADRRVARVEPDYQATFTSAQHQPAEYYPPSAGVPHPLDRIDQRSPVLDHQYYYQRSGTGVHVYIVDTGIYTRHNDFGGRAYPLFDFQPPVFGGGRYSEANGRGFSEPLNTGDIHGTAVAAQAGGKAHGAAKNCLLYSVRVGVTFVTQQGTLEGNINSANFVAGVNAVISDVINNNRRPAVINASVIFPSGATNVTTAVNNALQNGILVVTGAGNTNQNVSNFTPQSIAGALVVGGTRGVDTSAFGVEYNPDEKSSFSNSGSTVDVWIASGDYSVPMYDGGFAHWRLRAPKAHRTYETDGWAGTSFAAPVAAGVAALYLEANPTASPATVEAAIKNNATVAPWPAPGRILYSGCNFIPMPTSNPIDDSAVFVRQHYLDFLGRMPDPSGEAFWINEIESCGSDAGCRHVKRVNVSKAFFESIEFQETGGFVYRINRMSFTSYNDDKGERTGSIQPRAERFFFDQRKVGENFIFGVSPNSQLEEQKLNYAAEWIARDRFQFDYGSLADAQWVNQLYDRGGVTDDATRLAVIDALGNGSMSQAQALKTIAESAAVRSRFFNEQYVLMQYFGYLRRNPDDPQDTDYGGFFHWLGQLNQQIKTPFDMVDAFISSPEYRARFFDNPACSPAG